MDHGRPRGSQGERERGKLKGAMVPSWGGGAVLGAAERSQKPVL